MPIKDLSKWPDDQVPEWVLASRWRRRHERTLLCGTCHLHFGIRREVEQHCKETGHKPLMEEVKCS